MKIALFTIVTMVLAAIAVAAASAQEQHHTITCESIEPDEANDNTVIKVTIDDDSRASLNYGTPSGNLFIGTTRYVVADPLLKMNFLLEQNSMGYTNVLYVIDMKQMIGMESYLKGSQQLKPARLTCQWRQ